MTECLQFVHGKIVAIQLTPDSVALDVLLPDGQIRTWAIYTLPETGDTLHHRIDGMFVDTPPINPRSLVVEENGILPDVDTSDGAGGASETLTAEEKP